MLRSSLDEPLPLTANDRDTLSSVLSFVAKHYDDLCNQRNDLLHGTWFVGYVSNQDPHSAEFLIKRLKATKSGLSRVTGLPKTAAELKNLADRCDDVSIWVGFIEQILKGYIFVSGAFELDQQRWWLKTGPGKEKRTLHS